MTSSANNRVHPLFLIFIPFLLTHCTVKISSYFDSTTYIESTHTHLVNDSLQLHLTTPADIRFIESKKVLQKKFKKTDAPIDNLIALGNTQLAPHYTIFLALNPRKKYQPGNRPEVKLDTAIADHNFVLICRSRAEENPIGAFKNDCHNIMESISIGKKYRANVAGIFDIIGRNGNNYYQTLDRILDYPAGNKGKKWLKLQMALNFASFMAPNRIYDSLLTEFPVQTPADSIKNIIDNEAKHGQQAINALLDETKKHPMVMFNENHFYPTHRLMVKKLLPDLKKQGFTHLALEALGENQDSLLNNGHPPTLDTGFYTQEPHFGRLLRTAQELNFTLVSYENTTADKSREQGQVDNLYQTTIGKNDSAKVIVLAGLDHILEQPDDGKKWLGYLLHEKYNINPFTISQSHLNRYRNSTSEFALLPGNAFQQQTLQSVDYHLINNISVNPKKHNYSYKNLFDHTVQVSVFLGHEVDNMGSYKELIPYHSKLLESKDTVRFHIPGGEHVLVVYDKRGNIMLEKTITKADNLAQ